MVQAASPARPPLKRRLTRALFTILILLAVGMFSYRIANLRLKVSNETAAREHLKTAQSPSKAYDIAIARCAAAFAAGSDALSIIR